MNKILVIFTVLFCLLLPFSTFAGTRVINYGFEDWGDSCPGGDCSEVEDAEYTSGYIFTTDDHLTYWHSSHCGGTEVVENGDTNCGSRNAYEGTHYLHRGFCPNATDDCLQATPPSSNARCNVGLDSTYPEKGYGDNTDFDASITGDTIVIRFYFRTTGTWKGQVDEDDGILGHLKWIRLYGNGGRGDAGGCFSHVDADDADGDRFMIYSHSDDGDSCDSSGPTWDYYDSGKDFTDGEWHSWTQKVVLLNTTNTCPNLNVSVWIDDWNMAGTADGSQDVYFNDFDSAFSFLVLQSNFSGTTPKTAMGIDYDKFEVWDGSPGASAALTGSATDGVTEAEIVAGSEEIIITLTNDTWVDTAGADNQFTTDLIAAIDSGGAEAAGWDVQMKGTLAHGDFTRTSATVMTIVLPAVAAYEITTNETITIAIPANNLTGAAIVTASPTFEVTAASDPVATLTGTFADNALEAEIVTGGQTLIITVTNDTWVAAGATFNAQRQAIINGIDSAQSETYGWDAEVKAKEVVTAVVRTNATTVTVTFTAAAAYDISANETVTTTIPAAALVTSGSTVVATPTSDIIFFETSTEEITGITIQ